MIFIFSLKNITKLKDALGAEKKITLAEFLPMISPEHEFRPDDQAYLDIFGLTPAEIKKAIALFKKNNCFWGIIDPKGEAEDPAFFFFDGACDYIGPALIKKGLNKKRFTEAFAWSKKNSPAAYESKSASETGNISKRKIQKLTNGKFDGWKSIRAGTTGSFFFLFVSLSRESDLRSKMGEAVYKTLNIRLREILQDYLWETDALLWMETEDNSLFLVPPEAANGKAVVEAVLRILLNSQLISIEELGLSFPVDLTFAFHYGQTTYQAPGKTGTIISDSVNYIFHLGTKRAETGRLTISDDVPEEIIPEGFKDFFRCAGLYEGIPVRHSRRFIFN